MRDALVIAGATKVTDMCVIAYHLDEDALDVHEKQVISATEDPEEELYGENLMCTWPQVVYALLHRFLTDDVLQRAHRKMTIAQ